MELTHNDFKIVGEFVYIKNTNSPGMLLIHANWCGYCKKFLPLYKHLQQKLGNKFPCVAIENSEFENSRELVNALEFSYFPTIKFFDQTGKIINTYPDNLPRDEKTLLKYICKLYHHCIEKH
jgi:thiol-disulfide isomerase/thioredoxin